MQVSLAITAVFIAVVAGAVATAATANIALVMLHATVCHNALALTGSGANTEQHCHNEPGIAITTVIKPMMVMGAMNTDRSQT